MNPADKPDLSIVIATYDRPGPLRETLESCVAQRNQLGLKLELVVIDNHPTANGRAVVEAVKAKAPFPVRYETDLTRNMSTLRNRGFAEARADLVALIDDDEVAAPDWLDELVGALRKANAAVAVGPRHAIFETGAPPPYDPEGKLFARDFHLPDGADIQVTWPHGKPRYGLGTGNSLYDMPKCFPDPAQAMRTEFGDAGGEDSEMFVRLHRTGRKFVWAAKAIVTETVTANRTTPAYRMIRTKRETQHYVSIYLDAARNRRLAWITLMLKGCIQVTVGSVLYLVGLEFASNRRIRGRLLISHGLGKLMWKNAIGYINESQESGNTNKEALS